MLFLSFLKVRQTDHLHVPLPTARRNFVCKDLYRHRQTSTIPDQAPFPYVSWICFSHGACPFGAGICSHWSLRWDPSIPRMEFRPDMARRDPETDSRHRAAHTNSLRRITINSSLLRRVEFRRTPTNFFLAPDYTVERV